MRFEGGGEDQAICAQTPAFLINEYTAAAAAAGVDSAMFRHTPKCYEKII